MMLKYINVLILITDVVKVVGEVAIWYIKKKNMLNRLNMIFFMFGFSFYLYKYFAFFKRKKIQTMLTYSLNKLTHQKQLFLN